MTASVWFQCLFMAYNFLSMFIIFIDCLLWFLYSNFFNRFNYILFLFLFLWRLSFNIIFELAGEENGFGIVGWWWWYWGVDIGYIDLFIFDFSFALLLWCLLFHPIEIIDDFGFLFFEGVRLIKINVVQFWRRGHWRLYFL